MNGRSASPPPATPGPFCAVYSPLLPLLDARALPPEQEASVREHLADCAWCQNQLEAYAVMEDALRRQYTAIPSAQPLTMEDIMRANQSRDDFATQPVKTSRATNQQGLRTTSLPGLPESSAASRGAARGSGGNQRPPKRWATFGAVAAAALLVVLVAALFAALRLQTPGGPGGAPATTCATALRDATPAVAVPGFTDITFPAGAVMTAAKTSLGGPGQFTIIETDVCGNGSHAVSPILPGSGWAVSASFPYQGALLQPCAGECYQTGNSRYLALEQVTDRGGSVFTYHLRLAAPPPKPICNTNFDHSPLQGVQTSIEGAPLPPITYAVPDNAASLRGYDLCSSGSVASITTFLNNALPATGWTKVASNPQCFYGDQCWTKGPAAISWHVDDATDWHIAYHPATA